MLDEELEEINKAKSYTTTQAMRNNAKRGLELRKKYGRGGLTTQEAGKQGIGSGVARASDIVSGSLSLESVKRMHSFFSRHEKNIDASKRESDGGYTAGYISGLLWGGASGKAWARGILRREGLLKSVEKSIDKQEIKTDKIVKSLNEEKRLATFLVLEPQDEDMTTNDLHLDWYDAEMVEKSCYNFNRYCMKANLLHAIPTNDIEFIESYITKADSTLGGKFVKKGSWLATIYVKESEVGNEVWEGIKSGRFNGLSIQAIGVVEEIE